MTQHSAPPAAQVLARLSSRGARDSRRAGQRAANATGARRAVIDVLEMARQLEVTPVDLEAELIDLASREVLGYRPFQQALGLEIATDDWDRDQVSAHLKGLRAASYDRLDEMVAYAATSSCRRQLILNRFDGTSAVECQRCDSCTGTPSRLDSVDPVRYSDVGGITDAAAQAVVGLVGEASRLGKGPGRNSFIRALQGIGRYSEYEVPQVLQRSRHFGALRYMSESEIGDTVDEMVRRRRIIEIERRLRDGGTYIGLDVSV